MFFNALPALLRSVNLRGITRFDSVILHPGAFGVAARIVGLRHKRMRASASFLAAQANACGGIHRNQAASEPASKAANHHKRPRAPASFLAAKRGLWMALAKTKPRANPRARRPAPQAYPDGRRFRLRQNARRHKQAGPFRRARFQQTASATGVPDAPAAVQPGRICPDGSARHPGSGMTHTASRDACVQAHARSRQPPTFGKLPFTVGQTDHGRGACASRRSRGRLRSHPPRTFSSEAERSEAEK